MTDPSTDTSTLGRTPLLVIVGPTASGKTAAAIAAAQASGGEIVSADSMQVYRGMDIGTAKPAPDELAAVPHHLIDVVEPTEDYDVARFQAEAAAMIADIHRRGRLPILAGGSGLYVRAVVDALDLAPRHSDGSLRDELTALADAKGGDHMWGLLQAADPDAAARIPAGNVRRIIRALEVIEVTGALFSEQSKDWARYESPYCLEIVGLERSRDDLYARVDARVDQMIAAGLVSEVESLVARGYRDSLTAKQGLGYKELIKVIEGEEGLDEAVALIKQSTRRFAKRQYTWFRRDPRTHWIDVSGLEADKCSSALLDHLRSCPRFSEVRSCLKAQ